MLEITLLLTLPAPSMYDVDGNGWIALGEMTKIVKSIYKMMGPSQARDQFDTAEQRAEDIFRRMDVNNDNKVKKKSKRSAVLCL